VCGVIIVSRWAYHTVAEATSRESSVARPVLGRVAAAGRTTKPPGTQACAFCCAPAGSPGGHTSPPRAAPTDLGAGEPTGHRPRSPDRRAFSQVVPCDLRASVTSPEGMQPTPAPGATAFLRPPRRGPRPEAITAPPGSSAWDFEPARRVPPDPALAPPYYPQPELSRRPARAPCRPPSAGRSSNSGGAATIRDRTAPVRNS
jgi:hypothetical protein